MEGGRCGALNREERGRPAVQKEEDDVSVMICDRSFGWIYPRVKGVWPHRNWPCNNCLCNGILAAQKRGFFLEEGGGAGPRVSTPGDVCGAFCREPERKTRTVVSGVRGPKMAPGIPLLSVTTIVAAIRRVPPVAPGQSLLRK